MLTLIGTASFPPLFITAMRTYLIAESEFFIQPLEGCKNFYLLH
jgi:hypothetical protein